MALYSQNNSNIIINDHHSQSQNIVVQGNNNQVTIADSNCVLELMGNGNILFVATSRINIQLTGNGNQITLNQSHAQMTVLGNANQIKSEEELQPLQLNQCRGFGNNFPPNAVNKIQPQMGQLLQRNNMGNFNNGNYKNGNWPPQRPPNIFSNPYQPQPFQNQYSNVFAQNQHIFKPSNNPSKSHQASSTNIFAPNAYNNQMELQQQEDDFGYDQEQDDDHDDPFLPKFGNNTSFNYANQRQQQLANQQARKIQEEARKVQMESKRNQEQQKRKAKEEERKILQKNRKVAQQLKELARKQEQQKKIQAQQEQRRLQQQRRQQELIKQQEEVRMYMQQQQRGFGQHSSQSNNPFGIGNRGLFGAFNQGMQRNNSNQGGMFGIFGNPNRNNSNTNLFAPQNNDNRNNNNNGNRNNRNSNRNFDLNPNPRQTEQDQDRGLTENELKRLISHAYSGPQHQCTICFLDLQKNDDTTFLHCFHSFHSFCIQSWLMKCAKCPICNQNVRKNLE